MSEQLPSYEQGQVLDDIRRALGRSKSVRPQPLEPFVEPTLPIDLPIGIEELVSRFTTELTAVGGHIYRVKSDKLPLVEGIAPTATGTAAIAIRAEVSPTKGNEKLTFVQRIAARIADICYSSAATEVAISGSSLIVELGLADQLRARGLSVFVPGNAGPSEHDELVARLAGWGAGITGVDYAIAETGTIVLSNDEGNALLVSLLPPVHVALVSSGQIMASLSEAISELSERISSDHPCRSATLITGPSRTSDVELTLSIGVHGPKELHVILFDESDKL